MKGSHIKRNLEAFEINLDLMIAGGFIGTG